jgi:hypothetical protein
VLPRTPAIPLNDPQAIIAARYKPPELSYRAYTLLLRDHFTLPPGNDQPTSNTTLAWRNHALQLEQNQSNLTQELAKLKTGTLVPVFHSLHRLTL